MDKKTIRSAVVGLLMTVAFLLACTLGVSASSVVPPGDYSISEDGVYNIDDVDYYYTGGQWVSEVDYIASKIPAGETLYTTTEDLTNAMLAYIMARPYCEETEKVFYCTGNVDTSTAAQNSGVVSHRSVYNSFGEIFGAGQGVSMYSVSAGNNRTLMSTVTIKGVSCKEEHGASFTQDKYNTVKGIVSAAAASMNSGTTAEKVKKAYDYTCDMIAYDYSYALGDPYDALVNGSSVCAGYMEVFQLLMEEMGIPCKMITGKVNGGAHGWNAVYVDGAWYQVDATFADTGGNRTAFLLFGTDRRADIYGLGLASSAHSMINTSLYGESASSSQESQLPVQPAAEEPAVTETETETEIETEQVTEAVTEQETQTETQTEKESFATVENTEQETVQAETEDRTYKHWIAIGVACIIILVGVTVGLGIFSLVTGTNPFSLKGNKEEDDDSLE